MNKRYFKMFIFILSSLLSSKLAVKVFREMEEVMRIQVTTTKLSAER